MQLKKVSLIEARENYLQHLQLNNFGPYKIIDYKTIVTEDVENPILVIVAIQSSPDMWKAYEKPCGSKDVCIADLNRVAATGNKVQSTVAANLFPMLNILNYEL